MKIPFFVIPVYLFAVVTNAKTYSGPLGLTWDMSRDSIEARMAQKYEFVDSLLEIEGILTTLFYKGEFSDFSDSEIQISFYKNRILSVSMTIPKQGEFPYSKTWESSVVSFKEKYGKPDSMSRAPLTPNQRSKRVMKNYPKTKNREKIVDLLDATSNVVGDHEFWDMEIIQGKYSPLAKWKFNNSSVIIFIDISKPDESGERTLSTIWSFIEKKRLDEYVKFAKEVEKRKPSDF